MNIKDLIKKAQEKFNINNDMYAYFSPGRVNLIGEHIDYNGGYVLPCSLDIGTIGIASIREDDLVVCFSENFSNLGLISFSLKDITYSEKDNWVNYVKGIIKELNLKTGFNLYVKGEIPNGAGLSSSASLEILVGYIVNDLYKLGLSNLDLVKIAHNAENEFIKVKCGIMDQFIIGMAKNKSAILLNTSNLEYSYVNIDFQDYVLVIGNTCKQRTLGATKYNERRSECELGLKLLQKRFTIDNLCQLSIEDFNDNQDLIKDEIILKRVRHVISENERTKAAYHALKESDLIRFGKLLNQSHQSLKEHYEVTGLELDTLTSLFIKNGSIGARMTGAGFGGCMIALVKKDKYIKVIKQVEIDYQKITNLKPEFYQANIGNGVYKYEY